MYMQERVGGRGNSEVGERKREREGQREDRKKK
jgi:hypothetical protein